MVAKYNKIVLNIPHSSTNIPNLDQYINIDLLTSDILELTDWFTDRLFECDLCESVVFPYSRFYCDVERLLPDPEQEAKGQGVVYTHSISGERLRRELSCDEENRILKLYHLYREKLGNRVKNGDLLVSIR